MPRFWCNEHEIEHFELVCCLRLLLMTLPDEELIDDISRCEFTLEVTVEFHRMPSNTDPFNPLCLKLNFI